MSQFKKKLSAFGAFLAFMAMATGAAMADTSYLGGNATVINGSNVDFNGSTSSSLNVNNNTYVNGGVSQVDWGKLGTVSGQNINFGFSGLSQTIINRVLGGSKSQFLGSMTNSCIGGNCSSYAETGKVVIINPAGVLFGAGSTVDLNSLTVSTFDFTGAKNLTGDKATDQAYLDSLKDARVILGKDDKGNDVYYDYNKTLTFMSPVVNGTTRIEVNGATFDHLKGGDNTNKTVNLVSDNIEYINSKINVGDNYNYNGNRSFGKVSMITADGVTFEYLLNGYTDNTEKTYQYNGSTVAKNITIDNKGLASLEGNNATTAAIEAGTVHIFNDANVKDSNVNISDSIIKGTKLVSLENGDIYIRSGYDVNVANSRLESNNTLLNGVSVTDGQRGGEIFIRGNNNATVSNSLLYSAPSTTDDINAGSVRIYANGNYGEGSGVATVNNNTRIISKGSIEILGSEKADVQDSLIQAYNTANLDSKKYIEISASDEINIGNSALQASGNITLGSLSSKRNPVITIKGDKLDPSEGSYDDTILYTEGTLKVLGSKTTIDNAALSYVDLKFFEDGQTIKNDVTIKNNSTFAEMVKSGKTYAVADNLTLETNGSMTLDNATVQRGLVEIAMKKKGSQLDDDKTVNGIKYTKDVWASANAVNLNIIAEDDVTVTNNSNIGATTSITLTSNSANTELNGGSTLTAAGTAGNVTLNAKSGSVKMKEEAKTLATGNINFNAKNDIVFGEPSDNTDIDNTVTIRSNGNVNVVTSDGDIKAEKTTMPQIAYGGRLKFEATKGSNIITSEDSLKSVNVDYVAGTENSIITKGDMQFIDSTLESPVNTLKTINNGSDVIMNNLVIKSATENAEDTVTNILAKGDITTRVMNDDSEDTDSRGRHLYPADVSFSNETTTLSTLDLSNTKLIAQTKAEQTAENPSIGSITLRLANASNQNAGVELTAENYLPDGTQKWDETVGYNASGESYGPVVTLTSADSSAPIAVSKIITDKLNIVNTNIISAPVSSLDGLKLAGMTNSDKSSIDVANPKGYIEVRDRGGFNQHSDYNSNPQFTYDADFNESQENLQIWTGSHFISYSDDPNTDFILVYDRPSGMTDCQEKPDTGDVTDKTIDELEKEQFGNNPTSLDEFISKSFSMRSNSTANNTVQETQSALNAVVKSSSTPSTTNIEVSLPQDDDKYSK